MGEELINLFCEKFRIDYFDLSQNNTVNISDNIFEQNVTIVFENNYVTLKFKIIRERVSSFVDLFSSYLQTNAFFQDYEFSNNLSSYIYEENLNRISFVKENLIVFHFYWENTINGGQIFLNFHFSMYN